MNLTDLVAKVLAIGSGYRTYVAAAILGLTGLAQFLGVVSDALDGNFTKAWADLQLALTTLGQALAAFGLRAAVSRAAVTASE
jgi:hypothetical protein